MLMLGLIVAPAAHAEMESPDPQPTAIESESPQPAPSPTEIESTSDPSSEPGSISPELSPTPEESPRILPEAIAPGESVSEKPAEELSAAAAPGVVPVYRFWSERYNAHFYTASLEERNRVAATWPDVWKYEWVAYGAYTTQVPGTVPVYRFWSATRYAHFYTTSLDEKREVERRWPDVWSYEGITFYVYPENSTVSGLNTITRFWSDRFHSHFYTADPAEVSKVQRAWPDVWAFEGARFKAPNGPAAAPWPALNQRDQWKQDAGIARADWGYVDYIVQRESGWNPNAVNPSSGACGLVQIMPLHTEAYRTCKDPIANLRWADNYAKGRYGSWSGAYNFWLSNHWW